MLGDLALPIRGTRSQKLSLRGDEQISRLFGSSYGLSRRTVTITAAEAANGS